MKFQKNNRKKAILKTNLKRRIKKKFLIELKIGILNSNLKKDPRLVAM